MDTGNGIVFGAGGRRSRDPFPLVGPTLACIGRHHHGRLAAADNSTASSWTTTMASSSGPGGGGLATPPHWPAPRSRALGVIIMTGAWLRRVAGRRGHGQRRRHHLRCRGTASSSSTAAAAAAASAQREPTSTAEMPQIPKAIGRQYRARQRCARDDASHQANTLSKAPAPNWLRRQRQRRQ